MRAATETTACGSAAAERRRIGLSRRRLRQADGPGELAGEALGRDEDGAFAIHEANAEVVSLGVLEHPRTAGES